MTCTEEYKEHIEYTFQAFCKVVIRNAAITAARTRSRKYKREISLEYLTDEKQTIVQATTGEPEAVNAVLQHYGRYIRYSSLVDGQVDKDAEDYITQTLLAAIFKFRFDR